MIPHELRVTPQWLTSGEDKVPVSPKTGRYADVRDRSLYGTYEEAVAYATQYGLDIGFALTPEDPFVVIDLDATQDPEQQERHKRIYEAFPSYAELSRSGQGVHIWTRGTLPRGARRDKVEVYPADRYMICTGKVIRPLPVLDCQSMLDVLFTEISRSHFAEVDLEDVAEERSDATIFDIALNAVNGEKFDALTRGQWQDEYPSQSEADLALMNMLCFYTRSNEQAKRLFRYSALGQRDKALREPYLDTMIRKIRAEQVQPIDFSVLLSKMPSGNGQAIVQVGDTTVHVATSSTAPIRTRQLPDASVVEQELEPGVWHELHRIQQEPQPTQAPAPQKKSPKPVAIASDITYPPGFVGDIARYIVSTSIRPVPEVGIAAALALCAGIVGRQFNVSGTGLNQYIILLAKTGAGKEGGPQGIERILKSVRASVPVVDDFVGPGTFASGQAIIRTLDEKPCFLSILGEFGLTLQDLSDQNANSLSRTMRRVYLDLYTKSGKSSVLPGSAYSDSAKNTKILYAPAMTLLGESTPSTFYEGLSLHHIEDGLIPRFLIIEYKGERPARNKNAFAPPDEALVERVALLAEIALRMQANRSWQDVEMSPEAHALLTTFDDECDHHIHRGGNEAIRQLWNRAHLKAARIAALLCVADRPHMPVVNAEEAAWAIELVKRDVGGMSARFEAGDVGEGDSKQMADLERVIKDFVDRPLTDVAQYGVTAHMKDRRCVPYVYLQRRTVALSAFRKDRRGARLALQLTIEDLIKQGKLQEMPKAQVQSEFGTRQQMYFVTS